MKLGSFNVALVAASLVAGPVLAQGTLLEVDDNVQVPQLAAVVDDIDDWDVYSTDGTEIGEVEEVLGMDRNTATAIAVDFEGNGGFADRDVVIPLDRFARENGRLVLDADVEAVSQIPAWND